MRREHRKTERQKDTHRHNLRTPLVATLALLTLSAVSYIPLNHWFGDDGEVCADSGKETEQSTNRAEDSCLPPEREDDYVSTGIIPNKTGDGLEHELDIDAVERTSESTALHLTLTNQGDTIDEVRTRGVTPLLFDPVAGDVYWPLTDGEPTDTSPEYYGSDTGGQVPFFKGVHNEIQMYYPPLPERVSTVTFIGYGVGAMPGIQVTDVDEHRPEPGNVIVDGTLAEELDSSPQPDQTLTRPVRTPDNNAREHVLDTRGYVAGDDASLAREGNNETLTLDADALFEFDESELTRKATGVLEDTGETIRHNAAGDAGTITITGHTDGVGDEDYNKKLSEERAAAVAEELAPLLDDSLDTTVSGKGSSDPVAEEGGENDEEARRANRRVEIRYEAASPEAGSDDSEGSPLAATERHVGDPAEFQRLGEPAATREHDGFKLGIFPLRRDGAHLVARLDITNTTNEEAMPDLSSEAALTGGYSQMGTLGGVRLVEPGKGLTRHPLIVRYQDTYQEFADYTSDMGAGETRRLFTVYPAPSPDTDAITMRAGPFGEVADIPIT